MSKTIRKFRPRDFWRIGEHESWFSYMANKGLHLKKVDIYFAKFTKGEPRQMRYRIDVSQRKNTTLEQKEMHYESGWEYVTSYGLFNVFSSPVEVNAPELYTTPAKQADTLNYLNKQLTKNAIVVALSVALMMGILVAMWFINSEHYLALVEGGIIQQSFLIIYFLELAYTSIQAAVSIRALRKSLSEGKPMNHVAPWETKYKVNIIMTNIVLILAVCVVTLPIIQSAMSKTRALPAVITELPIVRLADVEQNPRLLPDRSIYTHNNIDSNNHYSYEWSLFSPLQLQSDESGIIGNELWKDGSGVYSPSISTWIYKLNFTSMNEGVLSDLIKRYGIKYEGGNFLEMKHPDFDKLIVHEGDSFKEIFAIKGKVVVYIKYYGYAHINSVIAATAEKIKLISK